MLKNRERLPETKTGTTVSWWNDSGIARNTTHWNLRLVAKLTAELWDWAFWSAEARDISKKGRESKGKWQLNADWVELLMNLPIGWTDTDKSNEDLAMARLANHERELVNYHKLDQHEGRKVRKGKTRNEATRNLMTNWGKCQLISLRTAECRRRRTEQCKKCCPAQVYPIFKAIMEAEKWTCC